MYDEEAIQDRVRLQDLEIREVYEGVVANTVSALTDTLYVLLPQLDNEGTLPFRHGPCLGWDRRYGGAYPTKGNKVLVAMSDLGNFWILGWWPYD